MWIEDHVWGGSDSMMKSLVLVVGSSNGHIMIGKIQPKKRPLGRIKSGRVKYLFHFDKPF